MIYLTTMRTFVIGFLTVAGGIAVFTGEFQLQHLVAPAVGGLLAAFGWLRSQSRNSTSPEPSTATRT
jgi:hypothetical protein